jgi:ParB-like protein
MSKKLPPLGRGLDTIMGGSNAQYSTPAAQQIVAVREIPLTQIEVNPFQPRTEFSEEELQELADSIGKIGIIQPITVRSIEGGRYQIISGERRFRASKRAGLTSIPAYVRETDDQGMVEMALVENIQRSDLNAIEIALSFQRLLEECHLSQEELSPRVGKNRATISNYMRLLKLPAEVQLNIRTRTISMGHAKAILGLEDQELQLQLMHRILDEGLSVRKSEELVRELTQEQDAEKNTEVAASSDAKDDAAALQGLGYIEEMQTSLEKRYGWGVKVNGNEKGSGKIVLSFRTEGERKELMRKLLQEE